MPFEASQEQFYISATPRPRKIAFLVNPTNCPAELTDAIFEFNIEHWGGRYNPIIPILDNKISDTYWALLKLSDPDIVYSFVNLEKSLILRIDKEISPFHFVYHRDYGLTQEQKPIYRIDINEQISIRLLYHVLHEKFLDPFESPSLLIYYSKNKDENFRYIQRNFGAIDDAVLSYKIPSEIKTVRLIGDYGFSQILQELAKYRTVVAPIQVSEFNSYYYEPEYNRYNDCFVVVIGNNIWDWLYFWNRNMMLPTWRRQRISQLCVSSSLVNSEEEQNSLAEFLKTKFWSSGSHQPMVLLVSNDVQEENLKKICEELRKKTHYFCESQALAENYLPPFKIRYTNWELPKITKRFQLSGKKSLFQNVYPTFLENKVLNGKWMLDLKIDYRPEKFTYTNQTYWWKLPKCAGITNLFLRYHPGRIINNGLISIETGGKEEYLELTVPSDRSVIYSYLIGHDLPCYTDDVRKVYLEEKAKINIKKDLRISDKGAYTRGVMKMFPSLWHTSEFIGNRYWRTILEKLCNVEPQSKDKFIEPILNKINKINLQIWENLAKKSEKEQKWLAEFILKSAKEQRYTPATISFFELLKMLRTEREEFKKIQRNSEQFDTSEERNRSDLLESLDDLVSGGIFEQGIEISCNFCGSTFWYAIEELKNEILCRGCRSSVKVQVESLWIYKLNDLLKNAITFHGVFPMIWALGELLSSARESFIYLPSICLYESYESVTPYAEIDIACILDGVFIMGEIKTSADGFTKSEVDKFKDICSQIQSEKAVIGAFRDPRNEIVKIAGQLENDLKNSQIKFHALRPNSYMFEPSYHI